MSLRAIRRGSARDQGFTLIEALVSLAIGGFVIATLATVTRQWLGGWSRGLPALQRSELLVASLDRVAADLAAAQYAPAGPASPDILFWGSDTGVTFVRRALRVQARTGLDVVRLAPGSGDVSLARSRAALPLDIPASEPADASPVVLLRAPLRVVFAYADADRTWRGNWRDPARLPRYIQVRVVDRTDGRPVLAPLTVAVRVEAPARCATTQVAGECDTMMGAGPERAPPAQPPSAEPVSRAP